MRRVVLKTLRIISSVLPSSMLPPWQDGEAFMKALAADKH
jgi:hypothetical protein